MAAFTGRGAEEKCGHDCSLPPNRQGTCRNGLPREGWWRARIPRVAQAPARPRSHRRASGTLCTVLAVSTDGQEERELLTCLRGAPPPCLSSPAPRVPGPPAGSGGGGSPHAKEQFSSAAARPSPAAPRPPSRLGHPERVARHRAPYPSREAAVEMPAQAASASSPLGPGASLCLGSRRANSAAALLLLLLLRCLPTWRPAHLALSPPGEPASGRPPAPPAARRGAQAPQPRPV